MIRRRGLIRLCDKWIWLTSQKDPAERLISAAPAGLGQFSASGDLPVELQRCLNVPRRISLAYLSEGAVRQIRIRSEEVWMVKGIKHFQPELQSPRFTEIPIFLDSKIEVYVAWGTYRSNRTGSVSKREGSRLCKR